MANTSAGDIDIIWKTVWTAHGILFRFRELGFRWSRHELGIFRTQPWRSHGRTFLIFCWSRRSQRSACLKGEGLRSHHLMGGMFRSHVGTARGMGHITVTIFGKYKEPYLFMYKCHFTYKPYFYSVASFKTHCSQTKFTLLFGFCSIQWTFILFSFLFLFVLCSQIHLSALQTSPYIHSKPRPMLTSYFLHFYLFLFLFSLWPEKYLLLPPIHFVTEHLLSMGACVFLSSKSK